MSRSLIAVLLIAVASAATAQYVPPVPKTTTGGRPLNRTTDIPLPSEKQQWVRVRSPHFITLSSASQARTREVILQLETLASVLRRVHPRLAGDVEVTRMIIFARGRDAAPYFDLLVGRMRAPGAFVSSADGTGTMLIDASRMSSTRTFFHELVHNLLSNSGTRLPLWLDEGLADFFSSAEVTRDTVRLGKPITEHAFTLRTQLLMPLRDLFAVQSGSAVGQSGHFYAQSWSVVDWLMRADRAAFFAFLDDVASGNDVPAMIQKHFHIDPGVIERSLQGRLARPPAIMTLHGEGAAPEVIAEPLDRDEVIIDLGKFLGGFEATRADADRFLESVSSKNGYAVAARADLRARDRKYDEAATLYERALELEPTASEIRLAFAESLLGNALGPFSGTVDIEQDAVANFRRARALAAEALAAGADEGRANAVIGTSFLVENDPTPGVAALQRAKVLHPARYDIALSLYALLLRAGEITAAETLYAEITARAKTPQAIFAARAVYVREQLALTNRLIAQTRSDEAVAILEKLIAATPDPNAKMELNGQLMKLRGVAKANQEIRTYNAAVAAANKGNVKEALEILEKLLETASDAAVVRDAIEFRKQLQKRGRGMRRSPRTL